MSGIKIAGEILAADDAFAAVVDEDSLVGGLLPQGTPLPAVTLRTVSIDRFGTMKRGSTRRFMERVRATVFARNYEEQKDLIELVGDVLDGQIGAFAGATEVAIELDGAGPDMASEEPIMWIQFQDLMVSYNRTI